MSTSAEMAIGGEGLLCFKRSILSKYPLSTQKIFYDEQLWEDILDNFELLSRSKAEKNYDYKQLVTYVLIKAGKLYLTYKRTEKGGEERLHSKYSMGVGGHVNIGDRNQRQLGTCPLHNRSRSLDFVIRGVWREIKEEVNVQSRIVRAPKLLCFVNDDSNVVGLVHFGLVWMMEIEKPKVARSRKGNGLGKIQFMDLEDLKRKQSHFEAWSQLLIDFLHKHTGELMK